MLTLNKNRVFIIVLTILSSLTLFFTFSFFAKYEILNQEENFKKYKTLSNCVMPLKVMERILKEDIKSNNEGTKKIKFTTLASLLAAKYYGKWEEYDEKDLNYFVLKLNSGATEEDLKQLYKDYDYFKVFYESIFSEFVGRYKISQENLKNNYLVFEEKYGLKAYSPIAYGYAVNFCDDFDNETNFAKQKGHFGNDIAVKKGTPFVAIESGVVVKCEKKKEKSTLEIKSFDGKRSYIYSTCGEEKAFKKGIEKGVVVFGGQILGFVGVKNCCKKGGAKILRSPYLHFGIKLHIKNKKKDSRDVYINAHNILRFLEHHKSAVKITKNGFVEKYIFKDEIFEKHNKN